MRMKNNTKIKNVIIHSERAKRTRENFSCVFQVIKKLYKKQMSADLTKGSFGHFSSFFKSKFQKRLNFQDFACSNNRLILLLTCIIIKDANISDKTK